MPERVDEPPPDWPGWAQSLFKIGRGEATAIRGLAHVGQQAWEHPDQIDDALAAFGERLVTDPVGVLRAVVGYDELAAGRYEDWLGQIGIGVLLGGGTSRVVSGAARLPRVRGAPRIVPLGRGSTPINSRQFAGRRAVFGRGDLGRRSGTRAPVIAAPARAAERAELARRYPRGVRFTRAGYPVFTPYAIERVRVPDLTGDNGVDAPRAEARSGRTSTPDGYMWHHGEDGRTMELVPEDLHEALRHTGGGAAIRGDQLGHVAPGGSFTWPERALGGAGGAGGFAGGPAAAPAHERGR